MRQPATTIDIRRDLVGLLPRLRRFALTLADDASTADGLVQAGCQRAIAKSNQWHGEGRLESWVYGLVRQQWTDDGRKRKPRAVSRGNVTDIRDVARTQQTSLGEPNAFVRMIAGLPEGVSSVFLLVNVEGHTYQQAADIMGLTPGSVATRLSTARLHFAGLADNHNRRS